MTNITLTVPERLHKQMKRHPEVKWSEVVRRVLAEKIRDLELMDRIAAKSLLTARDVDELDHVLKEALLKRYKRRVEG
jgi:predicted CopG family antitoxin